MQPVGIPAEDPNDSPTNQVIREKMKKTIRILLIILAALLLLLSVGPFLIPVPPLEDTVPPQTLGDPDSQFREVNGLSVHTKIAGQGEPTLILLHGFGASIYSWREVTAPLSQYGTVIAYDRPAFGLTERPTSWEEGANPYSGENQVEILIGLMDDLQVEKAILVGNSAGGTVALNTAFAYPERVAALILVDAAVYQGGGAPALIRPLLQTPQLDHLGPLIARQISVRGDDFIKSAWSDPSLITPEIFANYRKPLRSKNWDIALWELTKASSSSALADRIPELILPALVISGEDDTIVPLALSLRLAEELPGAQLAVFEDCGHLPQEECPDLFLDAVVAFILEDLDQ